MASAKIVTNSKNVVSMYKSFALNIKRVVEMQPTRHESDI